MQANSVSKSCFDFAGFKEKCTSFFRGIKNNPKEILTTVAITLFVVGALIFAGNPLAGGLLMLSGALLGIATGLVSKYVSKEKTAAVDSEDGNLNKVMRLPPKREITPDAGVTVTVKCSEDCTSVHEEKLI